jgi:hypothetical protein
LIDFTKGFQMGRESRWRAWLAIGSAVVALTLLPVPVQAQYLDPGAGSIIIQAVIAVVIGVAATVRIYWSKISAFVTRKSKRDGGL